ncbi:uncharacterized protein LOC132548856 [Ylistrum balloti]|uniref:uncharacterized protein LOC132548856 n=1 Tax=Ylistrum balloti TaxID=509963 RepID=UPI002905873D|nr:uncharacterized protein LOC132548856 [Ylistrum balloti]
MGLVDLTFQNLDSNHDSFLELSELYDVYDKIDANDDGVVSEYEYTYRATEQHRFFSIIFQELDYDGDGYLDRGAEAGQYIMMDTNTDNEVSRREYDTYYTKVVEDAIQKYGYLLGPIGGIGNSGPATT